MKKTITITKLTQDKFSEAVDVVLKTELDTREEIEHHLIHIDAHYVASDTKKIIGVIGWYQDTVNYATQAMGNKFPGTEAYWVGFFAVDSSYRGEGIGYALLQHLESVVRQKSNQLWVSSVPETRAYYERQGFELIMTGEISGNKKYFLMKPL